MSPSPDAVGWFAGHDHPRLTLLALVGAGLGLLGGVIWFSAAPLGHSLGMVGLRLATLGVIEFAFAMSGVFAFAVFERGFD